MSLIARTPSHVSSSTSVSLGKRNYGSQDPWCSIAKEDRSGRPDKGTDSFEASDHHYHEQFMESFSSASYSKLDHEEILLDGTAQSVRFGETLRDRSRRPDDINSQEEARPQQLVIRNDKTELELSVESRSFVNRVNDQVRKRQKRISNVTGDGEEHSMIWGMFMSVTMESAVFMGKNFQNNRHSIANTTDLTLKHMFDISTKLVTEQDEISELETIGWENHSWKYLSLIGDERIINLQRTKVHVFSDSVLCLGKILQNLESNDAWEQRLGWIISSQSYRDYDTINGESTEFEWHISQDSIRCSSAKKSKVYCTNWEKHQKISQE